MKQTQALIPLDSPSLWKEALSGINHSVGSTWDHCYAMHLTSGLKTYLFHHQSEHGRLVCPFVERKFQGYTDIVKPVGFSGLIAEGDCLELCRHWGLFVKQRGYVCGYLGLDPVFDSGQFFNPEDIYQYDKIQLLDLTLGEDELWANLSKNRKRQLRNWCKIAKSLVEGTQGLKDFFISEHANFLQDKGAESFYFFSPDTLNYLLEMDNVFTVGAVSSGRVVAVAVFSFTEYVGEYLFNVSLPEGRHFSAAMVWYGINKLRSLQVPRLNLGGGGGGMRDFKKRFGGDSVPLRCLKQVYRSDVYRELCTHNNANPEDLTGYFPAYFT